MIHGLFRDVFIMKDYFASSLFNDAAFKAKFPSLEQWKQLAKYKAVLQPLQASSMTLQTNDPSASSAPLIEISFPSKFKFWI